MGEHTGIHMYMSFAGFTCVVTLLLLLCRCCTERVDAFEIQRKCRLELFPR